jgi:hypothetical protein
MTCPTMGEKDGNMADVLNREYGLEKGFDPTGKQWVPAKVNSEQGLWQVAWLKDKGLVRPTSMPDYMQGKFTTSDKAKEVIDKYLNEVWDMSDDQTAKAAQKKERYAVA